MLSHIPIPLTMASSSHTTQSRAETAYGSIAGWYSTQLASSHIHHAVIPHLLDQVRSLAVRDRRRLLDITCGEGIFTRKLATLEPIEKLIGIDLSWRQLKSAQEREKHTPLGISYIHDDAQSLITQDDRMYDVVTSCLGLTDVTDVAALYRAVARVLRPGGHFIYSLVHPCAPVSTQEGTLERGPYSYFDEIAWTSTNPHSVRSRVPTWHRPLNTYITLALATGFELKILSEPRPTTEALHLIPEYATVPYAITMAWRLK